MKYEVLDIYEGQVIKIIVIYGKRKVIKFKYNKLYIIIDRKENYELEVIEILKKYK